MKIKCLSWIMVVVTALSVVECYMCFLCGMAKKEWDKNCFNRILKKEEVYFTQLLDESEEIALNSFDSPMWALNKISAPQAWNVSTGNAQIRVGIIDSGIVSKNIGLKNTTSIINMCVLCEGPCNEPIVNGHGTLVAGIITANNSSGAIGIAPNISLVDLRRKHDNATSFNTLSKAIQYADLMGIKIVNISCGAYSISQDQLKTLEKVIEEFDGIIVCSAGNGGSNNDFQVHYPDGLNFESIISVGACYHTDEKLTSSNYGKTSVDLFAPGSSIITTAWCEESCILTHDHTGNNCVTQSGGTSIAAPFVTGAAALIWSAYPDLTACEVKDAIIQNVDKVDSLKDYCVSGGRLNVYAALKNIKRHNYKDINVGENTGHKRICYDCGYTAIINHNYLQIESSYAYGMSWICLDCGYSMFKPGYKTNSVQISNKNINISLTQTFGGMYVSICKRNKFWNDLL